MLRIGHCSRFIRNRGCFYATVRNPVVASVPVARHLSSAAAAAAAVGACSMLVAGVHWNWVRCDDKSNVIKQGEHLVMSADCGGTSTRLMLYSVNPDEPVVEKQRAPGTLILEQKFLNIFYKDLAAIMDSFLKSAAEVCGPDAPNVTVAVLAVAGIATNNQARFTNLDWIVNGVELSERFSIARVEVINDFVAQGYGTLTLGDDELIKLNNVEPIKGAPRTCIGAGTGLGECFLCSDPDGEYKCYPSEGGHMEFAPRGRGSDLTQIELLKFLKVKFSGWNRISVERVVSGRGICNTYEFLAWRHPEKVDMAVHQQFVARPYDASIIAQNAVPNSLCEETLNIFADCYGSCVGTLCLQFMPFNGIYITGGVTMKLAKFLQSNTTFLDAYHDKGRVSPLTDKVPLYLVNSENMGQKGAHWRAVSQLKHHVQGLEGRTHRYQEPKPLDKAELVPPRAVHQDDGTHAELAKMLQEFSAGKDKQSSSTKQSS